ncbi:C-terminal binding protein [Halomonas sp. HP20-15]|uniref:C-terminal binding protein n=1 Tax=Halomonas sp. HP20-15 TaxID=3085901 RepID=UPI002981556C|nr:C-terminal binding protein [Halomonas sp. HP20-15]MDW5375404.1 C-terminal binding protein [Halomonas sp. HP20-15]
MRIVFSDLDHASHDIEAEIFAKAGFEVPLLNCRSEVDLIEQVADADIVLNQYAPFTKRVFDALPRLKQVIRYGVGVNNVDLAAATAAGVQVCNVPDYGMHEVSDHALALTLAMVRKVVQMNASCRNGRWEYAEAIPIRRQSQMTVGLIGLGRIGKLYAHKAHSLGFSVIGYDPFYQPNAADNTDYIDAVTLEELYSRSDVVAIFCPLTNETRHMVGAGAFAGMKPHAYIVNTSRGGIIDEAALAEALSSGTIAGAALDTTEQEPLPKESPLWTLDNCLVTPHMAWYSEDAAEELKRKVAEEAVRFASGEAVNWPVNEVVR